VSELKEKIARLKDAGGAFSGAMNRLLDSRAAARLDPKVERELQALLNEGASIKSAIRASTQMIDGAKRWIGRTFQTDALETIPFAPEIVATSAAASVSAIEHFMDKVRRIAPRLEALERQLSAMPEEKRNELSAVTSAPPVADAKPAIILLIALGGIIFWFNRNYR
jgi:hypothetical protein